MEEDYFKITADNFIDDDINHESYLWKFLSIEKFLSLLINEELHLTRLDLFEDKQEAISLEYLKILAYQNYQQKHNPLAEYHNIIVDGNKQNSLKKEQEFIQKSNFASCWYLAEDSSENVAMWNLYSSFNSVALKIKYKDFRQRILNFGIKNESHEFNALTFSKIHYVNFNEIDFAKPPTDDVVFIKDKSFEYEKEFRIVAYSKYVPTPPRPKDKDWITDDSYENIDNIWTSKSIKLSLSNFKDYPFSVMFHPKCPEWIRKDILKIMQKFDIRFRTSTSILKLR